MALPFPNTDHLFEAREYRRPAASWKWLGLLALPFLLCWAVLLITGKTFQVAWGGDEADFHWPLIQWFAERLPGFEPVYPYTSTTPLYHLLAACLIRIAGPHLVLARAFTTLFAVGGLWVLFGTLCGPRRHAPGAAALLCGVVLASCYFFGYGMRVLTDVPALAGCLAAMAMLFRFVDPAEPRPLACYLWGCLWCALTILTRQTYLFLGFPFVVALLASPLPTRGKLIGLTGLALTVLPYAALVVTWRGLVPPAFQQHHQAALVYLYPVSLPLLLLGFYTPFFFWRQAVRGEPDARRLVPAILAAGVALGMLVLFPLMPSADRPESLAHFAPQVRINPNAYFVGWIYRVAIHLPRLGPNSVLFWALLPLGTGAGAWFVSDAWHRRADRSLFVAGCFLVGFTLFSAFNLGCAQKYYDALVLFFLAWRTLPRADGDRWSRATLAALILLFSAYHVSLLLLSSDESRAGTQIFSSSP